MRFAENRLIIPKFGEVKICVKKQSQMLNDKVTKMVLLHIRFYFPYKSVG